MSEALRAQLERAIVRDRDVDREIAAGWSAVDREPGQGLDRGERAATRNAVRPNQLLRSERL